MSNAVKVDKIGVAHFIKFLLVKFFRGRLKFYRV
jgi:hypothetical protein